MQKIEYLSQFALRLLRLDRFFGRYFHQWLCRFCWLVVLCQVDSVAGEPVGVRQPSELRSSVVEAATYDVIIAGDDEMNLPPWGKRPAGRARTTRRSYRELQSCVAPMVGQLESRVLLTVGTVGADGWTILTPSADSRLIYVSSSDGNDANSGTSDAPLATINKALRQMRDGFPDWLLLKRGDEFLADDKIEKGGRSASEPLVISEYGTGPRPVINGSGFWYYSSNSPPGFSLNYVAITGIEFRASGLKQKGLDLGGGMSNILIENNVFSGYYVGVHIHEWGDVSVPLEDVTFRRNSIIDADGQGLLANNIDTFLVEENLFDYNGYGEGYGNDPGESGPTVFKHNAYLAKLVNLTARGNIFSRASNFGLKLATNEFEGFTDFTVENNLFFNNGITMSNSSGLPPGITQYRFNRGVVKDNVFTEVGRTFVSGQVQDMGAWLTNTADIRWDGNYFVHKLPLAGNPILHWGDSERHRDITVENSVVYDWTLGDDGTRQTYFEHNAYRESPSGGVTNLQLINNEIDLSAASYVDSTRTVGSYFAAIGGVDNAVAFMATARNMSKANWDPAFTADAVNDYIRAGFARILATPVFSTPADSQSADPLATVSWSTVDGADGYEVWYTNLSTDQNPFLNDSTASTNYASSDGLDIGRYRIWVRALQDVGPASPWSAPITLQINTPVVLNALPTDGANARPLLSWNTLPGAVRYEVWAKNLTTGEDQVVHDPNVTSTSYRPDVDLGLGEYRFWVRGIDAGGIASLWSAARDYSRTQVSTVIQPVVFEGTNSTPTISWDSIGGAVRYELWADNSTSGQTQVIHETQIDTTSFVPGSPLVFGQFRFWVRAFDGDGLGSVWSSAVTADNAPTLISPVLPTFDRRPQFQWEAKPGALDYELYAVQNGEVTNLTGLVGTSWTPESDLPTGSMKWWVRPYGSNSIKGPWSLAAESHIGGKTTVLTAGVPVGSSSQNGIFTWKAVSGASRYVLHVIRIGYGVVVQEDNLTGTSFTTTNALAADEYRVWVKAIDSSDNVSGIWSDQFDFTVVSLKRDGYDSAGGLQLVHASLPKVLDRVMPTSSVGEARLASHPALVESHAAATVHVRNSPGLSDGSTLSEGAIDSQYRRPFLNPDARMSERDADLIDAVMRESLQMSALG
jgi:Right handed beta helix region